MNVVAEQPSKRGRGRQTKRKAEVAEFELDVESSSVGAEIENVGAVKRKHTTVGPDSDHDLPPAKRTRGSRASISPKRKLKSVPKLRQQAAHIVAQVKRGRGRPKKERIPSYESKPDMEAVQQMNHIFSE